MSGEVDDKTAQALGRMAGAQMIISGAVSQVGDLYRLRIRALSVQSAEIVGQFNRNIPDNPTVTALVNSKATGYGEGMITASGTGSRTSASTPAATTTSTPAPVTVTPIYKIGDTGPAGGIIFYDKGNNSGGWRYLEAASTDLRKTQWQSDWTDVSGTQDVIGSGKDNTQLAVKHNVRAAMMCQQYSQGGFNDWFLPSKGELDLMYINLKMLRGEGNFANDYYWTSTQYDKNLAWIQGFNDNGRQADSRKDATYSVRPIRLF